ncbi:glycosyltransferase, partial [Gammaproteobacteria bacterium]|nr:glycosyltransferase [Gammaproteobacteria bacterium]
MTTVMIMAGGTGGHVYPALSVAKALREKSIQVVWLGTKKGLEASVIPSEGFDIEWIDASAVVGIQWSRKIMIPWMIVRAVWQSLKVVWRQKPNVVLGMGGFVAGPGGVAAWLLRRPLIIHEANARSGLTNRMLTMLATKVLTAI